MNGYVMNHAPTNVIKKSIELRMNVGTGHKRRIEQMTEYVVGKHGERGVLNVGKELIGNRYTRQYWKDGSIVFKLVSEV